MTLVSCEYSVGHEVVKISEGWVVNRSGLRATSTIGHVTSQISFHLSALITSDFNLKLLFIEIFMGKGSKHHHVGALSSD